MSSKRGRNRNSGAVSDRRSDDSKGSPEKSESSMPEIPLSYEYETEDGLVVEITPQSATVSREYQLSESDYLEFDAGVEWDIVDLDIARDGRGTDISGSVGLPGDVLGIGGGIEIDLATGEITGGEISGEVATVGLDVEVSRGGCEVSIGISIMGFGVTYSHDACEDEEEEDDDRESRPPRSDDEWSGPEARGQIEDIQRRLREMGLCSGAVHFTLYDYWLIGVESIDPFYILNLGDGLFYHEFIDPRTSPIFAEDHKEHLYWLFEDSLPYCNSDGECGKLVLDDNQFNRQQFDDCMAKAYPDRKQKKKPPPPGKPPMKEKECCRESIKLLREVHKALDVRELLDNQLVVPNRLVAPNAKGGAKLKSYLEISQWQIRMADHLGIHPFKALVTDANAAKKGNQKVEVQAMNATSATRQIMELLLENKGDSATRLNLQVRIAVAVGQILNAVSIAAKSIEQVTRFLGMPRKEKVLKVKMPFDFTFGKGGKGFGKSKSAQPSGSAQDKLDQNSEESTEALLPKFMQDKEQPIVVEMYDDNDLTLLEAIQKMNK
jgi:hypothetical protein